MLVSDDEYIALDGSRIGVFVATSCLCHSAILTVCRLTVCGRSSVRPSVHLLMEMYLKVARVKLFTLRKGFSIKRFRSTTQPNSYSTMQYIGPYVAYCLVFCVRRVVYRLLRNRIVQWLTSFNLFFSLFLFLYIDSPDI